MNNNNKLLIALALSLVLYGTNASSEEKKSENVITVTAQKRTENILEVPIAISVFDRDAIEQTGIQQLTELADFIPNLSITQGDDFESRVTIRGVGAQSRNIGFDSRVGIYIDGVYLGQSPAVNQDLIDLEQVEVLRGPQGTLFGKNTVAGAVNLISVKPHDDLEGNVNVNLANFNGVEIKANLNLPLGDTTAVKIAFSSRKRDGYVTNVYNADQVPTEAVGLAPVPLPICDGPGCVFPAMTPTFAPETNDKYNDQDSQSYRVQFRFRPSEKLDINLAFDRLESEKITATASAATDTFGLFANPFATGKNEVSFSATPKESREIFGTALNIDYDLGNDFSFRSITALRDTEATSFQDIDFSPIDYITSLYVDEFEQLTQEFQLISPDDSDFKYVLGLYFYQQEATTDRAVNIGNGGYWFFDQGPDAADDGTSATNFGVVDTDSLAFFMNGSYQINEKFKLGFGFRYSEETKDATWVLDGPNLLNVPIGDTPAGGFSGSHKDTNFAPTISLNYTVSENAQVYGKFSTGFKSGGFNLDWVDDNSLAGGIEFDKETVDSFEFGYKTTAYGDRLSLSAAYFITDYDDYQVNQFFDLGTAGDGRTLTSIRITNAAKVETSGLEIEASFEVTDNFSIHGSLGLLDATFEDFPEGTTDENGTPINAAGNRLPFASETSGSIGFQYYKKLNSMDAELLVRLDANFIGDYFTDIDNAKSVDIFGGGLSCFFYPAECGQLATVESGHVDAYSLVNGRVGLIDTQGDWEVYLWGRNLTDEDQNTNSGTQFLGTLIFTPQTPRTYGIEATYHF